MPDLLAPKLPPIGTIVMWNGLIARIPQKFRLCDGNGGRPDLRSKFLRGSPVSTDPGTTGGSDTHALTTDELAQHSHGFSQSAHTHLMNLGGGSGSGNIDPGSDFPGTSIALNANTSGISLDNAGSGSAHENRPAYYELLYLIRVP